MLIASEGDIVTCENGHQLYRITRDVPQGAFLHTTQFQAIHESLNDPLPLTKIPMKCPDCSARWMKGGSSGLSLMHYFRVHFEGGWRP